MTTCLRDHLTTKGVQLKARPCVPKSPCRELAARLDKKWARIIRRSSRDFLSALKLYHRSCAHHLRLKAANLETYIENRFGRADTRALKVKAKTINEKWSQRLQERHIKKLKKLHSPTTIVRKTKFRRSKRTCRRFKSKTPSPTRTGDREESPTVINRIPLCTELLIGISMNTFSQHRPITGLKKAHYEWKALHAGWRPGRLLPKPTKLDFNIHNPKGEDPMI